MPDSNPFLIETQGDLQSYIFNEFFPQHEDEGRDEWWDHIKTNLSDVLFILDGLDQLAPENRGPIDMLLKGNLLDKVPKQTIFISKKTNHRM